MSLEDRPAGQWAWGKQTRSLLAARPVPDEAVDMPPARPRQRALR